MTMTWKCGTCGGRLEWEPGQPDAVCADCGARQTVEPGDIYAQAGRLAETDCPENLEQAMGLYRQIRGWSDADQQFIRCRTRLGQLRWREESAKLKRYEDRHEKRTARRKKLLLTALIVVLLCIAVVSVVSLLQLQRYNRAAEFYTAGEYERAAEAFLEMGNYHDSRTRLYLSAVELYRAKKYEKALPYFEYLNGYIDHGFYLKKCQERLAAP